MPNYGIPCLCCGNTCQGASAAYCAYCFGQLAQNPKHRCAHDVKIEALADLLIIRLADAISRAESDLCGQLATAEHAADAGIVDIDSAIGRQYCLPVIRDILKRANHD